MHQDPAVNHHGIHVAALSAEHHRGHRVPDRRQVGRVSIDYNEFIQKGIYKFRYSTPVYAFKEEIEDPYRGRYGYELVAFKLQT